MKTLNEIKELPNLMIQHIAVDGGLECYSKKKLRNCRMEQRRRMGTRQH
ncbi:MAG: hypothetical protein ACLS48_10635 [[Eubacterium] siraeum]